ncbi:MAG: hypothetical protein KatS3mg102_0873 [Planctomycetota bacterium]|nr:MAG: hypothetical protein KatS3mg102_0873 [Planctomycetota bacterium]
MPRRPGALPTELSLRRTSAPITFIFRRGCPRCALAQRTVAGAALRFKLALEEVDLGQAAPELIERWQDDLPIVLIDGRRRFRRTVPPPLLEKALRERPVR